MSAGLDSTTLRLTCTVVLGFIPAYGCSWILKKFNLLRVPEEEEIEELDLGDFGLEAYPEYSIVTKQSEFTHAIYTTSVGQSTFEAGR